MSAYTELRAKQKERIKSAGAMQLHRIVDLEADEFCAQEGRYVAANAAADAPDLYAELPPKAERTEVAKFWRVAACFGIAVGSVLLLVHWGVSK